MVYSADSSVWPLYKLTVQQMLSLCEICNTSAVVALTGNDRMFQRSLLMSYDSKNSMMMMMIMTMMRMLQFVCFLIAQLSFPVMMSQQHFRYRAKQMTSAVAVK